MKLMQRLSLSLKDIFTLIIIIICFTFDIRLHGVSMKAGKRPTKMQEWRGELARVERRTQLGSSLGKKTSNRTEKEKLLEEEIVEEPPTSRRVNPQKRVLEKTRQKSVGPAVKKDKS